MKKLNDILKLLKIKSENGSKFVNKKEKIN